MTNHHFLAPRPLKPFESSPGYQNLPGESLIAHSDHGGPVSEPKTTVLSPKLTLFDLI